MSAPFPDNLMKGNRVSVDAVGSHSARADFSEFPDFMAGRQPYSREIVSFCIDLGLYTCGVVATILTQINGSWNFLIVEHKAAPKHPSGSLGPLGETARMYRRDEQVTIEEPWVTLRRGLQEELGTTPEDLGLRWLPSPWSGFTFLDEVSLGTNLVMSPVLWLPDHSVVPQQPNTAEVAQVHWLEYEVLCNVPAASSRTYLRPWLKSLMNFWIKTGSMAHHPVCSLEFPAQTFVEAEDLGDVRFGEMSMYTPGDG